MVKYIPSVPKLYLPQYHSNVRDSPIASEKSNSASVFCDYDVLLTIFFIYIYSICFVFSRRCPVLVSIPHYLSWLVCFARSMTFTSAARRSCASSVCGIVSLCEEYLHMRINPYALISNRNPFSFPFFHIQATLAPPHSHGRKRNL